MEILEVGKVFDDERGGVVSEGGRGFSAAVVAAKDRAGEPRAVVNESRNNRDGELAAGDRDRKGEGVAEARSFPEH